MFWVRDRNFYKSLVLLALPIIFQNIITFGVSLADNLMTGQLGEVAIASLSLGTRIQTVLHILIFGIENTMLILAAQYWGKKDLEHIRDVVGISMRMAVALAGILALLAFFVPEVLIGTMTDSEPVIACGASYIRILAVSYVLFTVSQMLLGAMRSVEVARIGLYNSLIALGVNAGLNYLLIFGHCGFPALGVRGAAVATLIARCVELGVVLIYVMHFSPNLRLKPLDFLRRSAEIRHDLLKYGAPLMAGQVTWAVNQYLQSAIIGHISEAAMAAISISSLLEQCLCMAVFGLSAAVGILTGKTIGAGEYEKMKAQAKTMQVIFFGLGFICSFIIWLAGPHFLRLYKIEPETMEIAKTLLNVLIVIVIGRCYQAPCLAGLVKAGGDTSFVFKNDTFFVFVVVLPSAFIAMHYLHAAPWVIYSCLLSDQILKCFVAVVKINSFNWMRNLTRPAKASV